MTHWRGTWVFMDHHKEHFPAWQTFIFGGAMHTALVLLRELLHAKMKVKDPRKKTKKRSICKAMCTKLYVYVFSVASILNWHGGWAVLEMYFGNFL